MSGSWDALAENYAANRIGYSGEVYETIAAYGLRRGSSILDVGCGSGLASEPFAANGFSVTGVDSSAAMLEKARERLPDASLLEAPAEALPFENAQFDVVISAQAFHWFDRSRALAEAVRVLRSGGIAAIWWKHLMSGDDAKEAREQTFRDLGIDSPQSGLSGGFREFYAQPDLTEQTLRVIPWRTAMPLDRYMGYERSRCSAREALGAQAERYFALLEQRLRERAPGGTLALSYIHYLYLGRKR